jgi:hypothetical protein
MLEKMIRAFVEPRRDIDEREQNFIDFLKEQKTYKMCS